MQVTLAEDEEKYEQAIIASESTAELQKQKVDLMSQVDTLQDRVQELGRLLAETHTECTKATNVSEEILCLCLIMSYFIGFMYENERKSAFLI